MEREEKGRKERRGGKDGKWKEKRMNVRKIRKGQVIQKEGKRLKMSMKMFEKR